MAHLKKVSKPTHHKKCVPVYFIKHLCNQNNNKLNRKLCKLHNEQNKTVFSSLLCLLIDFLNTVLKLKFLLARYFLLSELFLIL